MTEQNDKPLVDDVEDMDVDDELEDVVDDDDDDDDSVTDTTKDKSDEVKE